MKELVGIILLTVLVVFGSCNSNTNVSLVETSPQLFDVCQVSTGNPDYRNKELFINELKRKCPDFDYASPILDFSIFRGQNRHFCPRLVSFEHQTKA